MQMSDKPAQKTPPDSGESPPDTPPTIVLVGLMGAGKTHIGRKLAARLATGFVDSDDEIESAAGCTISEIFDRFGEAGFRDGERRVIARLLREHRGVISTGGGSFMNEQTRNNIAAAPGALSVWLRASLDTLVDRTSRRDNRPLLRHGDKRKILQRLMDERYPVYGKADIIVDSDGDNAEKVVDEIIARIGGTDPAKDPTKEMKG